MAKKQQGISQRAYAKLAGIRPSYVQRLVAEGKLPTLPDGSLNPLACDEARRRTTVVGKGQRRWARRHGAAPDPHIAAILERRICVGCEGPFNPQDAAHFGSPDPTRYCTDYCAQDVVEGYTPAHIRRRAARESDATEFGKLSPRGGPAK